MFAVVLSVGREAPSLHSRIQGICIKICVPGVVNTIHLLLTDKTCVISSKSFLTPGDFKFT